MVGGIELGFGLWVQMTVTVMALCIPDSSKTCITAGMLTFVGFEEYLVRTKAGSGGLQRRLVGHIRRRGGSGA